MRALQVVIMEIIIVLLCGCDSSVTQQNMILPFDNLPTSNNPGDSTVKEYSNGSEFLGPYQLTMFSGLRIDSVEVRALTPPYYLTYGRLIIYFDDQFVDSIPYVPNYHWYGVSRPTVTAGYISDNEYLLRVQIENDQLYHSGKSNWYFIKNSSINKFPSTINKDKNGIYENNSVNMGSVRKNTNKIIFFGAYYCNRETYCTFNLNREFKNHPRSRSDCYAQWQWE